MIDPDWLHFLLAARLCINLTYHHFMMSNVPRNGAMHHSGTAVVLKTIGKRISQYGQIIETLGVRFGIRTHEIVVNREMHPTSTVLGTALL